MQDNKTKTILKALQQGRISVDDALLQLKLEPFQDLGYAKVDHHRRLRQGVPEVIYGAGKTPEQMVGIVSAMQEAGQETVLITRLSPEAAEIVGRTHPMTYHEMGRIATIGPLPEPDGLGTIVIATGGTSDVPVAEEAAITAQALGNRVRKLYDVGVAGVHHGRQRHHRHCGDGGGPGQRGRGPGGLPRDCGAHQCGLWGLLPGAIGPAVHAQFLRQWDFCGEH